jgi:hypothetical protein
MMRKIAMLFMIMALLLVVSSCEGPMGPQGPEGLQGSGTNWQIVNLTAKPSDWTVYTDVNGLNRYYACSFNMPEISSFVYTDGNVSAYISVGSAFQVLPYVRHYQNAAGNYWTKTIDYDYSVGKLTIYVTNSDFAVDPPTDVMTFKVAVTW